MFKIYPEYSVDCVVALMSIVVLKVFIDLPESLGNVRHYKGYHGFDIYRAWLNGLLMKGELALES